jgi:hypothetical protein
VYLYCLYIPLSKLGVKRPRSCYALGKCSSLARGVGLPLQCGEAYCRMPVLPLPLKRVRAYRNKTALSVPAPAQNDCVAGVPICIEDVPATVGWRDTYRTTEPQQLKPQHQQNQNTKLRKKRTLVFCQNAHRRPESFLESRRRCIDHLQCQRFACTRRENKTVPLRRREHNVKLVARSRWSPDSTDSALFCDKPWAIGGVRGDPVLSIQ